MKRMTEYFAGYSLIVALLGTLGLASVVYFIYLSGFRALSQLEVSLFTVLIFILELAVGVYTGMWTERQHRVQRFVRSALRRTYGVVESVTRLQASIQDRIRRVSKRPRLDPSGLSDLWRETMDFVYSQLIEILRQAEFSIEDWRELFPAEARSIEERQRAKDKRIGELSDRLAFVHDLIEDMDSLTIAPADEAIVSLEKAASALEQDLESARSKSAFVHPVGQMPPRGLARDLMIREAFDEAIAVYDRMIGVRPDIHSFYIGRAKAKYFKGDSEGAKHDLRIARTLDPSDPAPEKALKQIEQGLMFPPEITVPTTLGREKEKEAHVALMQGKTNEARSLVDEAKQLGLMHIHVAVNHAMVHLLEANPPATIEALKGLTLSVAGEYMTVLVQALKAIALTMQGVAPDLDALQMALSDAADFRMRRSPLRFLKLGLLSRDMLTGNLEKLFELIEAAPSSSS